MDLGESTCGTWPGQSLSCPHSAHRDLPRGIGGSPGEVKVGCGSLGTRTLIAEAPGKYSYYYSFYLFHSVVVIVFYYVLLFKYFFKNLFFFVLLCGFFFFLLCFCSVIFCLFVFVCSSFAFLVCFPFLFYYFFVFVSSVLIDCFHF